VYSFRASSNYNSKSIAKILLNKVIILAGNICLIFNACMESKLMFYFVSMVGIDEGMIKKYIEMQGKEDSGKALLEF
jgi:hypothetical protein